MTRHLINSLSLPKPLLFLAVTLLSSLSILAQEKQLIQVKTFDQELKAYPNLSISINDGDYFSIDNKGTAFVELNSSTSTVTSVDIENRQLEAASWNLSKGILDIIVRRKSYQIVPVNIRNLENDRLETLKVTFKGRKTINATTDGRGNIELALALNESINSASQFTINGYETRNIQRVGNEYVLTVDKIKPIPPAVEDDDVGPETVEEELQKEPVDEKYFQTFDLQKLDSIQSLTVFYAIFKNYQIQELDEDLKRRIDAKFESLVGQLKDSLNRDAATFMGSISDTTYVQDDIKNLLEHARLESQLLVQQKLEFEEKIEMVNEKLEVGFENLNAEERVELLSDINLLEQLLKANENEFYRNQSSYHQIINSLKDRFFDLEELEGKLSASEAQRLEDQRIFRQRLIAISAVVIVFAVLIILLIYFSNRLKKQKRALVAANAEVKRVNENLEGIVYERTKLLEETYKELDTVLYRASHDLRSPVCSIVGLCNIVTTESGKDELMDRMVKTTTDMDRLLKKLSVISEIHQPGDFSTVVLVDVIDKIKTHFQPFIQFHNIDFVVDCPSDLSIDTVPNLIEIILANLIENALYYSAIKGTADYRVTLSAETVEGQLIISLHDNGIGLDTAMSHKLFDMFFRGTEYSKGNGLGLYIAQKSVQVLNGSITVESEPGQYSKFVVYLPLEGSREHSFSFLYNREEESKFAQLTG